MDGHQVPGRYHWNPVTFSMFSEPTFDSTSSSLEGLGCGEQAFRTAGLELGIPTKKCNHRIHVGYIFFISTWMVPKIGGFPPKWMVKIMVPNPIKMDDLGGFSPYFWKHPHGWLIFMVHLGRIYQSISIPLILWACHYYHLWHPN